MNFPLRSPLSAAAASSSVDVNRGGTMVSRYVLAGHERQELWRWAETGRDLFGADVTCWAPRT